MEERNKGISCETLDKQVSTDGKRLLSSLQSWAEGEDTEKRTAPAKCAVKLSNSCTSLMTCAKPGYDMRNGM